jgi:NADPH-dependent curcumin reductase CurA
MTRATISRPRTAAPHFSSSLLTRCRSALEEEARKAAKSNNTLGAPIKTLSKILAAIPDPHDDDHIFVAGAAGTVKHINIEVGQTCSSLCLAMQLTALTDG